MIFQDLCVKKMTSWMSRTSEYPKKKMPYSKGLLATLYHLKSSFMYDKLNSHFMGMLNTFVAELTNLDQAC